MEAKRPGPSGPPQLNMEIGEREAEGIYSNFVVISHSLSEFVLDFARVLPGTPKDQGLRARRHDAAQLCGHS
jgi:Protein of unknown function (DUF3467).